MHGILMDLGVTECELVDLSYVAQVLSFSTRLPWNSLEHALFLVRLVGTEAFSYKRVVKEGPQTTPLNHSVGRLKN
jgi:hypothetical protein